MSEKVRRMASGWLRGAALAALATVPAGCSTFAPGAPVAVETSDGSERYEGKRSRGPGWDSFALTARSGATCEGDLHPTIDNATGMPAAFGGVSCEDGRVGVLLFGGAPGAEGGDVDGVIDRRPVEGRWGGSGGAV